MGRAQRILGRAISNAVFVGESCAERALAVKAGMRSAPHPALARGVLAGGRPAYLLLRVRRDEVQRLGDLFDAAGVVPLRRTDVEGNAEIIALTTDVAIPQLQAGGVAVEVLPGPGADAAGDDLYLLRGVPKGPAPAAFAGLAEDGLRPVLSTRDGMVAALAPHQTIDDFHVGDGHGHNLKLLADPTLLFRRVAPPAFTADANAFSRGARVSCRDDNGAAVRAGTSIRRRHGRPPRGGRHQSPRSQPADARGYGWAYRRIRTHRPGSIQYHRPSFRNHREGYPGCGGRPLRIASSCTT